MSSIHDLKDLLLLHIIQFSYKLERNPVWKRLNRKFHDIVIDFQLHYDLYHHLEKMLFAKWKVENLTLQQSNPLLKISPHELEVWKERKEFHRIRTKQESASIRFENLFGGHEAFKEIPTVIPTCKNLIFDPLPEKELTQPIMKGFDGSGHRFISVKIRTGPKKGDPTVLYLFIFGNYWKLHYWSGNRSLLGKTACYLSFLVKPYGFNPATYDYCRKLFTRIMKNRVTFMNHYS